LPFNAALSSWALSTVLATAIVTALPALALWSTASTVRQAKIALRTRAVAWTTTAVLAFFWLTDRVAALDDENTLSFLAEIAFQTAST